LGLKQLQVFNGDDVGRGHFGRHTGILHFSFDGSTGKELQVGRDDS
jgi:hypothetical protein